MHLETTFVNFLHFINNFDKNAVCSLHARGWAEEIKLFMGIATFNPIQNEVTIPLQVNVMENEFFTMHTEQARACYVWFNLTCIRRYLLPTTVSWLIFGWYQEHLFEVRFKSLSSYNEWRNKTMLRSMQHTVQVRRVHGHKEIWPLFNACWEMISMKGFMKTLDVIGWDLFKMHLCAV